MFHFSIITSVPVLLQKVKSHVWLWKERMLQTPQIVQYFNSCFQSCIKVKHKTQNCLKWDHEPTQLCWKVKIVVQGTEEGRGRIWRTPSQRHSTPLDGAIQLLMQDPPAKRPYFLFELINNTFQSQESGWLWSPTLLRHTGRWCALLIRACSPIMWHWGVRVSERVFVCVKLIECIKYGSSFLSAAGVLARFEGEAAFF